MATVEDKTRIAANILSKQCSGRVSFELVEGTHFSPVLPRIELTVKKTMRSDYIDTEETNAIVRP